MRQLLLHGIVACSRALQELHGLLVENGSTTAAAHIHQAAMLVQSALGLIVIERAKAGRA